VIVVDTSAIIAVALGEPQAAQCLDVLDREPALAMSAGTAAECLIVAGQRGVTSEVEQLIARLGIEIVAVTAAEAERVAEAYTRWGRGVHRAALNFGDCFAYALANERRCPLLFVGNDFARTDLRSALR
jgi:ribonuclease VapC